MGGQPPPAQNALSYVPTFCCRKTESENWHYHLLLDDPIRLINHPRTAAKNEYVRGKGCSVHSYGHPLSSLQRRGMKNVPKINPLLVYENYVNALLICAVRASLNKYLKAECQRSNERERRCVEDSLLSYNLFHLVFLDNL